MFEAPSSDYEEGTIIEVIQPGYVLHDRLIRPAMVGVSKGEMVEKPMGVGCWGCGAQF